MQHDHEHDTSRGHFRETVSGLKDERHGFRHNVRALRQRQKWVTWRGRNEGVRARFSDEKI